MLVSIWFRTKRQLLQIIATHCYCLKCNEVPGNPGSSFIWRQVGVLCDKLHRVYSCLSDHFFFSFLSIMSSGAARGKMSTRPAQESVAATLLVLLAVASFLLLYFSLLLVLLLVRHSQYFPVSPLAQLTQFNKYLCQYCNNQLISLAGVITMLRLFHHSCSASQYSANTAQVIFICPMVFVGGFFMVGAVGLLILKLSRSSWHALRPFLCFPTTAPAAAANPMDALDAVV